MASFIRIIISSGILISFCEGKKHDLLTGLLKQFFKLLTMQRKTNLKCFIVVIDRAQFKGQIFFHAFSVQRSRQIAMFG